MISKELLDKFKTLYKEQYDVTLTDEEATAMATDLVNLMKVILQPDPMTDPEIPKDKRFERRQDETIGTNQLTFFS